MAVSKRLTALLLLGSLAACPLRGQEIRYEPSRENPYAVPYAAFDDPELTRKTEIINNHLRSRDWEQASA